MDMGSHNSRAVWRDVKWRGAVVYVEPGKSAGWHLSENWIE